MLRSRGHGPRSPRSPFRPSRLVAFGAVGAVGLALSMVASACVPEGHDDPLPQTTRGGSSAGQSGAAGAAAGAGAGAGGWVSGGGTSGAAAGGTSAGAAGGGGAGASAGSGDGGTQATGGGAGTQAQNEAGSAGQTQNEAGSGGAQASAGSNNAGAPACVPQCGGKQCGDDGCNGSCGSCEGGQSCDGAGQCKQPTQTDHCPVGPADNMWSSYPDPWGEDQCVVQWSYNSSIFRAHYAEPGHLLYASQHHTDGNVEFTSAAFLQNLGISALEAIKFCQEAPQNGSCVHQDAPDCSAYTGASSCTVLFNWSYNGTPVRLRRTGSTLWAENQDPGGSWNFSAGSWMDAAGGFSNPNTGKLCFAAEKPAGDPEPCP